MANLLARLAENIFWLARYMERAENLARILDVTDTFARDRSGRNWLSVVQINADNDRFFARHAVANAESVLDFYLLDPANPTSIRSTIQAAHENARALRPILSIEMWAQLNMTLHWIRSLTAEDITSPKLSRLCSRIREACQTHAGIVEGTFSREEAWYFYWLGKQLERADQTTRLLDIKYHLLLPHVGDIGSALDLSQWNALLRAAGGYQAFRRLHPVGMNPTAITEFLLLSDSFPRSVSLCMRQAEWLLGQLRSRFRLREGTVALERLDEMRAAMTDQSAEEIISNGLHEFI
ncbi:MAG TPA: alpha-E domain-containing protein, partial [Rhodospirillaceae bacterium]|nr:alpha-E domain-containing protein [Rhodospirillaceae bacterium]